MKTGARKQIPTAAREARWFYVPGILGGLLFLSMLLRWLPAAASRSHEAFGVAQAVTGDLILFWKSLLRCAVAYAVTAVAFDWLTPIRWRDAFFVAVGALLAEVVAELLTSTILSSDATVAIQLLVSAIAYAVTLSASRWVLHRRREQSQ